ncbi:hypothetical protein F5Y18DRAFT_409813 [Xylariaceae sp. FL1019]|nr:hypothetical protein F5Y18DRAFT_409813 [Xylariaceae sp. FL1019]
MPLCGASMLWCCIFFPHSLEGISPSLPGRAGETLDLELTKNPALITNRKRNCVYMILLYMYSARGVFLRRYVSSGATRDIILVGSGPDQLPAMHLHTFNVTCGRYCLGRCTNSTQCCYALRSPETWRSSGVCWSVRSTHVIPSNLASFWLLLAVCTW